MKGYLGHIRRLVSILCALVVLNAGALPACADYEELTEPTEKLFETDAISDDLEQKIPTVSNRPCMNFHFSTLLSLLPKQRPATTRRLPHRRVQR